MSCALANQLQLENVALDMKDTAGYHKKNKKKTSTEQMYTLYFHSKY